MVHWNVLRLVAKGFSQIEGLDYTDTFSLVIKPGSTLTILSVALMKGKHGIFSQARIGSFSALRDADWDRPYHSGSTVL